MALVERLLHRVQLLGARCEPFDGGEVVAIGLHREHGARLHGLAVEVDGARTARRGVATDVGARESTDVADVVHEKRSRLERWIVELHARAGYHKTLIAIANKHARMLWAILAHGEAYDPNAWQRHHAAQA